MTKNSRTKNEVIPEIIVVSDPEKIKIMLDETRREILQVMRKDYFRQGEVTNDMSVSEIAEILDTAPQRIYHHIDKLIGAGFVIKSREEKKIRSTVTYYRRTARGFIIAYEEMEKNPDLMKERSANFVNSINDAFHLQIPKTEIEKLAKAYTQLWKITNKPFEKITQNLSSNFEGKDIQFLTQSVRAIVNYQDDEYHVAMKAVAEILYPKIAAKMNL